MVSFQNPQRGESPPHTPALVPLFERYMVGGMEVGISVGQGPSPLLTLVGGNVGAIPSRDVAELSHLSHFSRGKRWKQSY